MLENIRFYSEEEKNNKQFAKHLASFGDIYVNDAFSCSHRAHASIDEITNFLPSYSGLQFDLEVSALKKITSEIQKPITCIIGGSKVSTKINIIKNLIPKFDNVIIVGGMANNIIKYMGNNIGKSLHEENTDLIVKEILSLSKKTDCEIIYPKDVVVAKDFNGAPKHKELNEVTSDEMILDIGLKTIDVINNIINKSKTILWNGPAGYFENPDFANGSNKIAKKIIEKNLAKEIYSVAGGGDTVSLLNNLNAINNFNFVSTAGGAFLEYLEGKELPGIKALN
jgi:phosphoglycerate kinase